MIYLIIIPIIIFVVILYTNKIQIDTISFIDKTLPLDRGLFGVYCFTGKQGSGKTYSLVKYVKKNHQSKKIYSNITIQGLDYMDITSENHLLSLKDKKNVIIIYDEIFTLLQKSSKINAELMEFLTQQRKMGNIFLTTAQEWLEIPITFRRFVRIQIDCNTKPLGKFGGILIEDYYDAYQMKWDQLENEYIAPKISRKISKYQKRYMKSYNTYERIKKLE